MKIWIQGVGKEWNNAFYSQRVYNSTVFNLFFFFKKAWFWINLNSYHLCLQNYLRDWVGWSLGGMCFLLVLGKASEHHWGPVERMVICRLVPSHVSGLSRGCTHVLEVAIAASMKGSLYAIKTYVVYTHLFILHRAGSFSPEMPSHRRGLSWPPSLSRSFLLLLLTAICLFLTWFFLEFIITSLLVCLSVASFSN